MAEPLHYCSQCGAPVTVRVPEGEDRPRHVCDACGTIHYQNPRVVAGCVIEWDGQVLLCRRAIEPRRGFWVFPAGFMENGETIEEAAEREAREEANARVEILELYTLFDIPHLEQVHCMFRSRLLDTGFSPGVESLEVRLFREEEIPWRSLGFASVTFALQHYFEDRRSGQFRMHRGTVHPACPV